MDRRTFLESGALAGVAVAASLRDGTAQLAPRPGIDEAPARRADRPVVVDGLNVSDINDALIAELRAGGVDCMHKSMALHPPTLGAALEYIAGRADVVLATRVADIRAAVQRDQIAIILGSQHANEVEGVLRKTSSESLRTIAAALRSAHQAGLRIHGIAYNLMNVFGGGCLEPHVGLSRAGRRLVEEMHRLGIVLDVGGHTGEQTSLDALALSDGVPVVCTHTTAAALNPNLRATSDRVIEAIAATGGVVGLAAISDFIARSPLNAAQHGPVSPQAGLDDLLDHFDYLRRLVGADHVGLGSDFVAGREGAFVFRNLEENFAFTPEALSEGPLRYVAGFESIAKLPDLRSGLQRRGWTAPDIDNVLGGNWLRVYQRVWGG